MGAMLQMRKIEIAVLEEAAAAARESRAVR